jgi:hypothetical protein
LLAFAGSAAPASGVRMARLAPAAPAGVRETSVSQNWAGYAVAATDVVQAPNADGTTPAPVTFTSVTGTWRQPRATCTAGSPGFSSVWVGLGGFSPGSQALEQVGTEVDCTGAGRATSSAWYELLPAPPVDLALKILPGDLISASVNVSGNDVLVQIKNRTRRTSFTKQLTMTAPVPDLSSAEWVVEAPSTCSRLRCKPLPLANFGSVAFSRIATTASAHAGTLSDPTWSPTMIQLVPDAARPVLPGQPAPTLDPFATPAGAVPTEFTPDGRSFGVSWIEDASGVASTG